MQPQYRPACVPVKKKCVAFAFTPQQPFVLKDSNAIYELLADVSGRDMDPSLMEDAMGDDIEVEVEFEEGPEDEDEEDWDDIGTD